MSKLQLRHLEYFIMVAEELNYRQAAQKLFVSQPSLSLQISQLEEILEVKLLDRDKRHVALTKPGKSFYQDALRILSDVKKSVTDVRSLAGVQPLNVGIPDFHSFEQISRGLHEFSVNNPDIRLQLKEMTAVDMYDGICAGDIDIGFMSSPLPPLNEDKLKILHLFTEDYLICLPPSHPEIDQIALDNRSFDNYKLIFMPRKIHPSFHDTIMGCFRDAGFTLDISYEATNTQAQYGLVAADLGMCVALKSSPLPQGLTALPLDPPVIYCPMGLAWHPRCAHAKLHDFIDSVTESMKSAP